MAVTTTLTKQLNIQHPIMLAGMGQTSGAPLAAAVSNAGGLGVIGGVGYTNEMLKEMIAELKSSLRDPSLPFGVDLLIPQVGGAARKTNVDYTKGKLDQLVETIIEGGAKVFVSAVGVAPKRIVDRLHEAGVLYMNMVGQLCLVTTMRLACICVYQTVAVLRFVLTLLQDRPSKACSQSLCGWRRHNLRTRRRSWWPHRRYRLQYPHTSMRRYLQAIQVATHWEACSIGGSWRCE
jgi:hypothetical protein